MESQTVCYVVLNRISDRRMSTAMSFKKGSIGLIAVVKVRGARGGLSPLLRLWRSLAPLLESEPSLPTAGPKLSNSTKINNVRCRINKF